MKKLDWRNKEEWLSSIPKYAGDIIDDEFLVKIKWDNHDDVSRLLDGNIVKSFKDAFNKYYSHAKAFHACRPADVSTYYEKGLLGQDKENIEAQFREIFKDVDDCLIEKAILDLEDRGSDEKGRIFFICDDQVFIERYGHYLIQGSEYIMSMSASLSELNGSIDYKYRLRDVGIPTIFEVDIPLDKIPQTQINELVKIIIASWASKRLSPESAYNEEMSFVLHSDLSPNNIIGHSHPKKIKDPHNSFLWYYPKVHTCKMCR